MLVFVLVLVLVFVLVFVLIRLSQLLQFHVCFFSRVARPPGVSLRTIAANYDEFYGRPRYIHAQILLYRKPLISSKHYALFHLIL